MNEAKDTTLVGQMARILSNQWLQDRARELGVIRRQRLVHVADLVWVLILAFGAGKDKTLTSLCSTFNLHTGLDLAQSSFNKRFTPQLASLMASCVTLLLQHADDELPKTKFKYLQFFSNITAIDASVIRVHDSLRTLWPSTSEKQAAIKLHAVYNVTHSMPHKFKLTLATVHDSVPWRRLGKWVCGRLFLVDMGYYSFSFLARLQRYGALFVTRAKSNFNPVIVKVNNPPRGRAVKLEGKRLLDVLPKLQRRVLDVQVEVGYKAGKYKGKQEDKVLSLRVVLVRNQETGQYHRYICNLDPSLQNADAVAALYKLRWEIELLFKALKSEGGLSKIPGKRKCVIEVLLWASIARLLLGRIVLRTVRKARGYLQRHIPERRWDKRLSELTELLLDALVVRRTPPHPDPIMRFLLRRAPDPNSCRRSPLDSLAIC